MKLTSLNKDDATIEHAIIYLREQFEHHDRADIKTAYKMTSVVSCKNFNEWQEDEDFNDLFSIVGGLEIPGQSKESRMQQWSDVGQLISKLTRKYSI